MAASLLSERQERALLNRPAASATAPYVIERTEHRPYSAENNELEDFNFPHFRMSNADWKKS